MATVRRLLSYLAAAANVLSLGCGKPVGLEAQVMPLAVIHVQVTGDLASVMPADVAGDTPHLHAALVWGLQWQPEPFCVLPPESPEAAAVIAAGCPDSFGFVPDLVGADTEIVPGSPATIELTGLPAADVMVGDLTARIAYASVIVYDDRNLDGVLDLRHPPRQRHRGEPIDDAAGLADMVYGASFISMTLPDRRVAYREGGFDPSVAFYPRSGCPGPPKGFSILSAGGFSASDALTSALAGQLPSEETAACATSAIDDTLVIPLQSPANLTQLACTANDNGGVTYYQTPSDPIDLSEQRGQAWACTGFPRLPGDADAGAPTGQQLVISGTPPPYEPCLYTMHYTLRGCDDDPSCPVPSWDITATPPAWWPCPTSP